MTGTAEVGSVMAAIALAILLFLLSIHRAGERTGRLAKRLETRDKTIKVGCVLKSCWLAFVLPEMANIPFW